jgi:mannose/cellobiose epimerase-like protein (N-acyl-D-glucosamine 2-epimerase family)
LFGEQIDSIFLPETGDFMRVILPIIIFVLAMQSQSYSPYLQTPEKMYGFVDSCAAFWMPTWDSERGGFYTKVDRDGTVRLDWGSHKNCLTQSRNAYGLVRAYMLSGKEAYLERAREALAFMMASTWDASHGGFYEFADADGNPDNTNWDKDAFFQHYALLGLVAYWEATADTTVKNWIDMGLASNEAHLWDTQEEQLGYWDKGKPDWSSTWDKSFNATVDAITTHLLNLYLLTEDPLLLERLLSLADNIRTHLATSMETSEIGFAEQFSSSWQPRSGGWDNRTVMGHVLKTAWCMARIYQLEQRPEFLETAEAMVANVLDNGGYDFTYGGPYKDFNRFDGSMYMYGIADTAKAWWQMEQAITAGLMLYDITAKQKYLDMADASLQFFMTYFVDREYGEVYENRARDGGFIEQWGATKGSEYKAGYHSIETGYYVYLYGKLFVHAEPVRLHYRFAPVAYDRHVLLAPLPWRRATFGLDSVYLNDDVYTEFEAASRQLYLPAGSGGNVIAVFAADAVTSLADNSKQLLPMAMKLLGNYPNPFNPSTVIQLRLARASSIEIRIFNSAGQQVDKLPVENLPAGRHSIRWQPPGTLSSGTYFYQVRSGNQAEFGKMLLLR